MLTKLFIPLVLWGLLGSALWRLWGVQEHLLLWWSMVGLLVLDFIFARALQQIAAGAGLDQSGSGGEEARWLRIARGWWFCFDVGAIIVGVYAHGVAGLLG